MLQALIGWWTRHRQRMSYERGSSKAN